MNRLFHTSSKNVCRFQIQSGLYVYMTVHAKSHFHASDGNLISFESLDIATSNSASGGFISASLPKLQYLKWITLRATHSIKQATSVFSHDSVYQLSHDTNSVSKQTLMTFIASYYYKHGAFPVLHMQKDPIHDGHTMKVWINVF